MATSLASAVLAPLLYKFLRSVVTCICVILMSPPRLALNSLCSSPRLPPVLSMGAASGILIPLRLDCQAHSLCSFPSLDPEPPPPAANTLYPILPPQRIPQAELLSPGPLAPAQLSLPDTSLSSLASFLVLFCVSPWILKVTSLLPPPCLASSLLSPLPAQRYLDHWVFLLLWLVR